jgi:eukaryotic-like serine/threonine-protein kinase
MTMIGQYEIRELLGTGGIGQVHAAFDTVLEREVAIKSLRPELLNDKNFADRFRSEATSLAKLSHPNITTLYNLLSEGGNLYLIMECVRGETLEELLKQRGGRLGVRESLAITAQIADGLGYAHSMGIVHRDVKPANVMITATGTVKIMDFGIARVRGSQRLTREGSALGTLAYMSPEQVRGEEADGRSDLYSLAIMLYEMLSGAVPFEADTEYELMQAHIKTRAPRLSSCLPAIDSRVDAALARALAKNPEQRFASAREFSDALGATALRTDASKIVYEGTRLIDVPRVVAPAAAAPSAPSALQPLLKRLTFIRPDLRLPAVIGAGGAALIALLLVLVVVLTPLPGPRASNGGKSAAPPQLANQAAKAPPAQSLTPVIAKAARPEAGASRLSALPADRQNGAPAGAAAPASGSAALTPAPQTATPAAAAADAPANLAEVIQAAERGDAVAENTLGIKYAEGTDGLPRDETKALDWYRKAALQGNAKAETNLGDMYLFGRGGLDKNSLIALSWYLKAADQQWPDAQYRLGYMYEVGLGTGKNVQRAVELYRSAASAGYADAQNVLGVLYATGSDGLQQDDRQAIEWYRKAAVQGSAKAQKNLGDMYFFGRGTDQRDYNEAMAWYKRAADQDFPDAQFRLGFMYEKGLGTSPSEETAKDLYQRAARNGSVDAQRALDRLNRGGGGGNSQ